MSRQQQPPEPPNDVAEMMGRLMVGLKKVAEGLRMVMGVPSAEDTLMTAEITHALNRREEAKMYLFEDFRTRIEELEHKLDIIVKERPHLTPESKRNKYETIKAYQALAFPDANPDDQ